MFVDMFLDNSLRFIACDFRVDFLRLAPSLDFETSSRAVKKTIGSHLKLITKRRNRNRVIALDSHLKTTLEHVQPRFKFKVVAAL